MRNKPRQLSVSSSVRPTLEDSSKSQTQELTQSPILSGTPTQKDTVKDNESAIVDEEAIEEVDDELPPPTDKRNRKVSATNKQVPAKPPGLASSSAAPSVTPAPPPPTFARSTSSTPGTASPRLSSLSRGPPARPVAKPVPVPASRSAVLTDSTPTAESTASNGPSSASSSSSSRSGSSTPATTAVKAAAPQKHGFAAINSNVRSLRSTRGESPGPSTSFSSSLSLMGQSIVTDTLEPLAAPSTTTAASTRRSSKSKPAKKTQRKGKAKAKAPAPALEEEEEEEDDDIPDADEMEEPVAPPPKVYPVDENGFLIVDPEDIPNPRRGKKASTIEEPHKKVINIEKFTMGHLCKEIPIGQTNEEYEKYELARRDRKHKREAMLREKKRAKIEGRPLTSIEGYLEERSYLTDGMKVQKDKWNEHWKKNSEGGVRAQPQVKLNAKGDFIIDPDSVQVDRHQRDAQPTKERKVEEEDKYSTSVNSATFSTREKPERWDQDETSAFYKAISQWGTDFNMITQLFPGRSRRQIKAKFKLEERRNPGKIHLAILRKLPVDIDSYSEQTGAEIYTPDDINKELEKVRRQHEEHLKEVEDNRIRARADDAAAAARADEEKYGPQPSVKKKEEDGDDEEEVVGYVNR